MIIKSTQNEQGMVLVVSLVILVALTLLGLTAMQRSTMDLAMAGNQRETGLMFQSAEVGLSSAQGFIDLSNTNADFDQVASGLYTVRANDPGYSGPDYFDETMWAATAQTSATNLEVYEQPRYIVEYLGDRSQNPLASINIGGYGAQQTGQIVSIYRMTSRGVGLTGNSRRYLQAYYGKDRP